jgi:hypothetical protein
MSEITDDGKFYTNDVAQGMINTYQTNHPSMTIQAIRYGKTKLEDVLGQPNAAGLNMYYATENGQDTLVIYAVDSSGNKIDGPGAKILESGIRIPK